MEKKENLAGAFLRENDPPTVALFLESNIRFSSDHVRKRESQHFVF